jgi:hypothetical protein
MGILALSQVTVLVVLAVASIAVGVAVAIRPGERRLGLLRPLTLGTTFAALAAVLSGMATAFSNLAEHGAADKGLSVAWAGIAEATVPGIIAFSALAVAWGLAALGMRRLN